MLFVATVLTTVASCAAPQSDERAVEAPRVLVGAEVLAEEGFASFSNQRVGLIVNQASVVDSVHVVDAMLAAGVDVGALFGPEHGVRGQLGAGVVVEDGKDPQTGLPVYSLYGATRKPDQEVLRGLDVLVFDIQDVGARFYTYISTMGLAMQAAAEAGVPFVVLDRPNPLGGEYVSGFVLDPEHTSFVGQYPIPVAHGFTVGELARAIVGEEWLDGLAALDLTVIEMDGWRRNMQWPALDREWIPTSPNIPDFETALVYPGMCYLEALTVAEGRGTPHPFLQFGAPWVDEQAFADNLSGSGLAGVTFEPRVFTPRAIANAAPNPRLRDTEVRGAKLTVTDAVVVDPLDLGLHVLTAFRDAAASSPASTLGESSLFRERAMLRLAGTDRMLVALESGAAADDISSLWRDEVADFVALREQYLLYR